jgi:release factor glutamine methyltransferase
VTSRAEVISRAVARLTGAGVESPERDARLLYRWASGMDGAQLSAAMADPARPAEIALFEHAVEAREGRVPVSYITGTREFWGRTFMVGPAVLDPRPETETLIAAALERPAARVLDLGTGSGCILATLLSEWPEAAGVGTDISLEALEMAARNLEALGLAGRVELLRTDWLDGIEGPFDLVVSNPPYIAFDDIGALAPEVRNHEPLAALTPGGDGLGAYCRIAGGIGGVLAPGGRVIVEIGAGQADAVTDIFARAGLTLRGTREDMDGRPRVVIATPD